MWSGLRDNILGIEGSGYGDIGRVDFIVEWRFVEVSNSKVVGACLCVRVRVNVCMFVRASIRVYVRVCMFRVGGELAGGEGACFSR